MVFGRQLGLASVAFKTQSGRPDGCHLQYVTHVRIPIAPAELRLEDAQLADATSRDLTSAPVPDREGERVRLMLAH